MARRRRTAFIAEEGGIMKTADWNKGGINMRAFYDEDSRILIMGPVPTPPKAAKGNYTWPRFTEPGGRHEPSIDLAGATAIITEQGGCWT
jgi:hypothetical protein